MKYAILHSLMFTTPAGRDSFDASLSSVLAGRPTWGEIVNHSGEDENGNPRHRLVIRFNSEADMNEVFDFIKTRMDAIPVTGTVSKHWCTHDEEQPKPCKIKEKYTR